MDQAELYRILSDADRQSGIFSKIRNNTFNKQDLDDINYICNAIRTVIKDNSLIEKRWLSLVRNFPLEMEIRSNDATGAKLSDSSKVAIENLRQAAVEYLLDSSEPEDNTVPSALTDSVGCFLEDDSNFLFGIRMRQQCDAEKSKELISFLNGLETVASSNVTQRELFGQLAIIPYVLYWNRHYFEKELEKYDQISAEINSALDQLLGSHSNDAEKSER